MGTPTSGQAGPKLNDLARYYHAAEKLMNGETAKCRRCLGPLRFEEADGKMGIVCDTGCTRFFLPVKKAKAQRK